MKIKEDSTLWSWYLRYYKEDWYDEGEDQEIPHPKNLCRFWWISMVGLSYKIFSDFPFLIVYPLLILVNVLWIASIAGVSFVFGSDSRTMVTLALIWMPFAFAFILMLAALPFGRFVAWSDKQEEIVKKICNTILFGSMFCLLIYMMSTMPLRKK